MTRILMVGLIWFMGIGISHGAGYTFVELDADAVGGKASGFKVDCFSSYGATATEHFDSAGSTAFGSASFYCLGLGGLVKIDTGESSGTFTVKLYSLVGSSTSPTAFLSLNYAANTSTLIPIAETPLIARHAVSVQMVSGTGTISVSELWKK